MTILVIGASRGLGKALCEALVKSGHSVIAGMRTTEEVKACGLQGVRAIRIDATAEEDFSSAAKAFSEEGVRIDAVVYNAGVLMPSDRELPLGKVDLDELLMAFRVNAAGMLLAYQAFSDAIPSGGQFMAITSEGGSFARRGQRFAGYAISKTAANKAVQLLRNARKDINVLAVHPGRMDTDMGHTTAQITAGEAADGLVRLLEHPYPSTDEDWFINYKGEKMPL